MTLKLEEIPVAGYEKVVKITDDSCDLTAIISIHNTALGPALGGIRIHPYKKFDDALDDVLRLSKGMTYKSALVNNGLGGGKSVIIANPKKQKSKKLLESFAKAVDMLQGQYICAEDVGCTTEDVAVIQSVTPYVTGLMHKKSSGDPAPYTAWGTFRGVQSIFKWLDDSPSVEGKVIAIQGLGAVGSILVDYLFWAGAKLKIADIDKVKAEKLVHKYGAEIIDNNKILYEPCDVLVPCALGGIFTTQTIKLLKCRGIAGCANNQLQNEQDAQILYDQKILYAPDFIINSGGLINVGLELSEKGYDPIMARNRVHRIYDRLLDIYHISEQNKFSTNKAAISLAEHRLKYKIGKRKGKLFFHHFYS